MNERLAQTILLQGLWLMLRSNGSIASADKQTWRNKAVAFLSSLDTSPTEEEESYLESLFPLA